MKKPLSDTGWQVSGSGRCCVDYQRTIVFEKELSAEELKDTKDELQNDPKCPGWTPIFCRALLTKEDMVGAMYIFHTTYDSSD